MTSSSAESVPDEMESFPLLSLPSEIVLLVIELLDEREYTDLFPAGPNEDIINLSATNHLFSDLCRPLVWRTINYKPLRGLRPDEYRLKRNLRQLRNLFAASRNDIPPIQYFACSHPQRTRGDTALDLVEESTALAEVISILGVEGKLKALWLVGLILDQRHGEAMLQALALNAKNLVAMRFNQVHLTTPNHNLAKLVKGMPQFEELTTLQIMHGSKGLMEFVRLAPKLQSLLLWPENRRMGHLLPVITSLLPNLRFLSLDAVREASCFATIGLEIENLIGQGQHVPLEEIFLEGPQTAADRDQLIRSLTKTTFPLKRLALYHLRTTKPGLLHDIVKALPSLEGLTLVSGDTQEPVSWEAPLEEYIIQLKKLKNLKFFAFDRETPLPSIPTRIAPTRATLEYQTLERIGAGCSQTLKNAVAITLDVSQGSAGYFATYEGKGASRTMSFVQKTVQDFLIPFDRWVVIPDQ